MQDRKAGRLISSPAHNRPARVSSQAGAHVLSGRSADLPLTPHKIQGGGYSMAELTQLDACAAPPDGYLAVSSELALQVWQGQARSGR